MTRPDIVVAPPEVLARSLAARVATACRHGVDARGVASVALTGGSTFRTLGGALTQADIAWDRVHIFWGDERAAPLDHPDSNYRLAREVLLDRILIPATHVHPMPADTDDLETAASSYQALLTEHLDTEAGFDVVLLGVGSDGHVCSLFPDHALLSERLRRVAAVYDSPKPPPRRLTITLRVIEAARLVVVMAIGQDKSVAVSAAIGDDTSRLPLARVVQAAASVSFLLDPSAAALLSGSGHQGST